MSFSSSVKDELLKLKIKSDSAKRAMLCAFTHTAGSITIGSGGIAAEYVSEHHGVGKLIAQLAPSLYTVETAISVYEHERLRARNTVIKVSGIEVRQMLMDMGALPQGDSEEFLLGHIPQGILTDDTSREFLRGAFLGGGSVSNPRKGYHLEFVCGQELFACELCEALNGFELNARVSKRKSNYITYIKEGERVSDFLTLIGAMNATMEFENVRIERELTNNINRRTNFEDANMQKAAKAAAQQRIDIETIVSEKGLGYLPQKLREICAARLENEEATLTELSQMIGISRSAVNSRLKRVAEIAQELRIANGDKVFDMGEEK